MRLAGYIVYRIFLNLFWLSVHFLAFFQPKARTWLKGRKSQNYRASKLDKSKPLIWFHVASSGEFEQAVPIINSLKQQDSHAQVLVTFFSPSGIEFIKKKSEIADEVCYLPFDFPHSVRQFLNAFNPTVAVFVKYEFWYHAVSLTAERGIPVFLVAARFRKSQIFFQFYGKLFRELLFRYQKIFVQDESDIKLLKDIDLKNMQVSGDTRFDRVLEIKLSAQKIAEIEKFADGAPLFIAGSTWPADEALLEKTIKSDGFDFPGKFVFFPHEISKERIQSLKERFEDNFCVFSTLIEPDKRILIVDRMGLLSSAYAYASYAFVGGGFGKGIHNILEAAVYGAPVFFGPNYYKFREATDLVDLNSAFEIQNYQQLTEKISEMEQKTEIRQQIEKQNAAYFLKNAKASVQIVNAVRTAITAT